MRSTNSEQSIPATFTAAQLARIRTAIEQVDPCYCTDDGYELSEPGKHDIDCPRGKAIARAERVVEGLK